MVTQTAPRPKAKASMTLCLWVRVGEGRQGPTRPETHKLCALPTGHGGMMHVLQTSAQIRRWWPDA